MLKFITVAEKVYARIEEDKLFSENLIENLNSLVSVIRRELKDTSCKLKYNFIDFEECLNKPSQECRVKLDISLMPKFKNKGEYIMWLAGFIEKITVGGTETYPPLTMPALRNQPPKNLVADDAKNNKAISEHNSDMIVKYFDSPEYKKNCKPLAHG